ncbi:Oidioi.mRNA.OKI2018_I69.chr2.g4425.t1.cds [Oikopleura dioica]|uniref:Oidioi.mRNA.OKI2018_I69.chr2.g4425.t1.cds n=1 Tax=Oikopleura dioica TaxID=34765 RepID=A0ABN7T2V2_OIKDI|nr:Oidioi.mRNA.OKI2018_I69.chr2.g4425.t1.cds [Oikopleura dioica]
MILLIFSVCIFSCKAKRGGGSGGSSSTGESTLSNESSLVDAIAFTPRELFIGLGILVAVFWIYVISRNISRIPKKTKMPCDFNHINDPIKRQQEIRYVLTQSKILLEDRKSEHRQIIRRLWGDKDLLDKSFMDFYEK